MAVVAEVGLIQVQVALAVKEVEEMVRVMVL
jgi:hypothetical protein